MPRQSAGYYIDTGNHQNRACKMADNMIERVAMEIYASTWEPGNKADMEKVETARKQARAAIGAMRVPSSKMLVDAGTMDAPWDGETDLDRFHIEWWQAMIDAALNEDE